MLPPSDSAGGRSLPSRLYRLLIRLATFLVVLLLGFLAVLYLIQDRMIFPGTGTQGRPEAIVRPRPGTELVRLTTSLGEPITALFGPALGADGRADLDATTRPALLYFYGNALCLAYSETELERFRRLGLNVLIPDYLGYGMSGGRASEQGCRATAETCYDWLRDRGFQEERIIACGWSLGGAVAIDLASRRPVGGLIAFSTFTSTREMGQTIFPLALPSFFYSHKFDSLGKLPSITCPILLGHGRRDPIVPFAMQARLAAAAKCPVTTFVIDGAEHNDFYDVGGPQIDGAIQSFLTRLPR